MNSDIAVIRIDHLQTLENRAIKWRQTATHPDDIRAADDQLKKLRLQIQRLKEYA